MKNLYDALKEENTLKLFFPQATGVWQKDREQFSLLCEIPEIIEEDDDTGM